MVNVSKEPTQNLINNALDQSTSKLKNITTSEKASKYLCSFSYLHEDVDLPFLARLKIHTYQSVFHAISHLKEKYIW